MAKFNNENGHWYTDEGGNHYFVKDGETPKEGWEATKRRKMIDGGKYKVSEDGKTYKDVSKDEYEKYEAEDAEGFDDNIEEDYIPKTKIEKQVDEWIEANWDKIQDQSIGAVAYKMGAYGIKGPFPLVQEAVEKSVAARKAKEEKVGPMDGEKPDNFDNNEGDTMDPNNPKYKDFGRSHITNAKEVDQGEEYTKPDGTKEKLSIIEYIPYGSLQDGSNKKLYGVVTNYDGSDAPDIGAIVSPSLESAKEDLEHQIKLGIQGPDRYMGRGQYDQDWFNMLKDQQYDFDDETRKRYADKYGWDFNKSWEEHEHIKNDPYKQWQESRKRKDTNTEPVTDNGDGTFSYNGQTFPSKEALVGVYGPEILKHIKGKK